MMSSMPWCGARCTMSSCAAATARSCMTTARTSSRNDQAGPAGMTGASAFRHEGALACEALEAAGLRE